MLLFGAYLLWMTFSIPRSDLVFASRAGWWFAFVAACLLVVASVGAAYYPHRYHLGAIWLGLASSWCITRGTTLILTGSRVFTSRPATVRAGIGWLLWVPALMAVVSIVLADAMGRYNTLSATQSAGLAVNKNADG